jgi:hypothetical protein
MTLAVELMTSSTEASYSEFLLSIPTSMLFQSVPYRDFLIRVLPNSESRYFLARENGRIVGALPTFVLANARFGAVMNSLPFFGSNGGVLVPPGAERERIGTALLQGAIAQAEAENMASVTIVSHPLDQEHELYRRLLTPSVEDERIGQITPLPPSPSGDLWPEDAMVEAERRLFQLYHVKTRNVIRKAQSSEIEVAHEGTRAAMEVLYEIHRENMTAIGGVVKPWSVFEAILQAFVYDRDYRVYLAKKDGITIAGLLVFYFNRITEYFTPVTRAEYRGIQPQSLLCLTAMKESLRRGHSHWNWGGTGLSQTGVYEFKRKWGTEDHRYRYFVRESADRRLRSARKEDLAAAYPNFFSVPFSVLSS